MDIHQTIKSKANPERARSLSRYFKTGKGQYGEGDIFLGITVPESRKIAIQFKDLPLEEVEFLLKSKFHEERLIALLLLVHNYNLHSERRQEIFDFYIKNTSGINNWDLVDLSASYIFGRHIFNTGRTNPMAGNLLFNFVHSKNIWERRIAIISTAYFIKNMRFDETLEISKILLTDKHDLIHKAVGWMLREVGKKDSAVLEKFLKTRYKTMPRTMLRYALEKFPEAKRKDYLNNRI